MKKALSLILCAVLMLSLCACSGKSIMEELDLPPLPEVSFDEEVETNEQTTAVPGTPVPSVEEEAAVERPGCLIVSYRSTKLEEYDPAEGKQLILTFSYDTPVVYMEGREDVAAVINEYIAMLDETFYTGNDYGDGPDTGFNAMLEFAQDNFSYVADNGLEDYNLELSCTRSARTERADERLLNFVFSHYEYTGGAHGIAADSGYVFDMQTGERLSLTDLTEDMAAFREKVVSYMIHLAETDPEISDRISEDFVAPEDYPEAFAALLREGSWYFSQEGLVLFSSLYELGPYAAGMATFTIPYSELEGVLLDKWMPIPTSGSGELSVTPLSEIIDGTVEILDRVEADEGGTELCLSAQGIVNDLGLYRVFYDEYSQQFQISRELWHGSYLQNAALQIVAAIPEGIPDLMVSYRDGEGALHQLLLTQNGSDGSYTLISDTIEFLG